MVGAQNEGHLQAYIEAEVPGHQWWTAQDERVRDNDNPKDPFSHKEAHGQIRRVGTDFYVSGEYLRTPGQGGSAGNVINCRCTNPPTFSLEE